MDAENKICCPEFDPSIWDKKEFTWDKKLFIMETLPQFFHLPFPWMIGKMITRMWAQIDKANARPEAKDYMWLAYNPSSWKSENYISVTKEVPGANNVTLSGAFLTMVFDGPYNFIPKYIKEMDKYVAEKNKKLKKYYFYYTTCPKCAKKYGHNYIVIFAQVE
jgi:hypothetical protein